MHSNYYDSGLFENMFRDNRGVSSSTTTGSRTTLPNRIVAAVQRDVNRIEYQKSVWLDIALQIQKWSGLDRDSRNFNVRSRFFNPASASTFLLFIAPGHKTWPTVDILRAAADTVNAERVTNPYIYKVVEYGKGDDAGRVLM